MLLNQSMHACTVDSDVINAANFLAIYSVSNVNNNVTFKNSAPGISKFPTIAPCSRGIHLAILRYVLKYMTYVIVTDRAS